MDTLQINYLKFEVEKTFGQKVLTSSDCLLLSQAIQKKTRTKLSFNTLRRFFNLMNTSHSSSMNTINVFVRFCGFSSSDDFIDYSQKISTKLEDRGHQSLLNYLVFVFKKIKLRDTNDKTFIHFVHETIDYLKRYPNLVDQFQQRIARTHNGQYFYFEKFIYLDKLNSNYGKGLTYYLEECRNEKGQIFGHYLLGLKSWLNMDDKEVFDHYTKVAHFAIGPRSHQLLAGWYFSLQLLAATVSHKETIPILFKAREYYSANRLIKEKETVLPLFEFYFSGTLILTGLFEAAMFYIEEALKKADSGNFNNINAELIEPLKLYKTIALAHLGETSQAREMLASVKPEKFSFLYKQFMTCLYLLVKQQFNKSVALKMQIRFLVNETGFHRLQYSLC